MKKKILNTLALSSVLPFIISGCMGIKSSNLNVTDGKDIVKLSNGSTIAYAYMKDGEKLLNIKTSYSKPNDGEEIIKISKYGFYPNYSMNSKEEAGEKSPGCLVVMKESNKNYKFCRSNYTGRTMVSSGVSVIWNAAATLTTVGLNVASGAVADPKFFDKDKFLEIVKNSKLSKVRTKLNEIKTLESKHNKELTSLYNIEFDKYKNNIKNIKFKYIYNDRSGLLYGKELKHNVKLHINKPSKNLRNYSKFIENKEFSNISDLPSFVDKLKIKLENDFQVFKKTYENTYLKAQFKEYKITSYNNKKFEYNKNITFNGEVKYPKSVKYIYNKKITVPIKVRIDNVDIKNLQLPSFNLKDKNLLVEFNKQKNVYIEAIATNETTTFLTINSLTSYLGYDVNTLLKRNIELAPESVTLSSNSNYSLLSSKMLKNLSYNKVTKRKLINKKLKYGFAVKYNIVKNNISKTIYKTRKYSLLQLYKNHL